MSEVGEAAQDRGLVSHIGPLKVDWPRTIGYYGGISVAVAAGVLEPPLAIFIAAIPLMKLLNRPRASFPERFVGQVLDGAAKPVGGSSEATIELDTSGERGGQADAQEGRQPAPIPAPTPVPARHTIWAEARQLANRAHASGVAAGAGAGAAL